METDYERRILIKTERDPESRLAVKRGYRIVEEGRNLDWFHFEKLETNAMREAVWVRCFTIHSKVIGKKSKWLLGFCRTLMKFMDEKTEEKKA